MSVCLGAAVILSLLGVDLREERVTVYADVSGGEGKEWSIYADPPLSVLGEGNVLALLLDVEAPSGTALEDISVGDGARGMTLTVSYGEECRSARVLLDGIPMGEGNELLRVVLSGEGKGITVSLPENGDFLYCMGEDGEVMTYPLVLQQKEGSIPDGRETEEEITEGTEPESSPGLNPGTSPGEAVTALPDFVGCRETLPVCGVYAVRFLFGGEEGSTPVFCLSGKGNLTVDTGRDGAWSHCTFRGLSADERYVFGVMTKEGLVGAVYENGEFAGYVRGRW